MQLRADVFERVSKCEHRVQTLLITSNSKNTGYETTDKRMYILLNERLTRGIEKRFTVLFISYIVFLLKFLNRAFSILFIAIFL